MDGENLEPRFLVRSGKPQMNAAMDILNKATNPVHDGAAFNVLSSYTCLNPGNDIVVEANFLLNYINVYRIDGDDFRQTIAFGDKLDSIDELCYKNTSMLDETILDLKAYDDCFAVMYKPRGIAKKKPTIYLFSWDCSPLQAIPLEMDATAFDIDAANGQLYLFDYDGERLYRFRIQ